MNSNFSGNVAMNEHGGAVLANGLKSIEIFSCRNRASFSCGAALMSIADTMVVLRLGDVLCIQPLSNRNIVTNNSVSIIQNTFIGNEAGTGGALSLSTGRNAGGSASVWINESTFVGNKAEAYGGAIMLGSGFVHTCQSNFTSNNASQLGGALCLDSGGEV